jgi:hypothetical protein
MNQPVLDPIIDADLAAMRAIRHGFFTRQGGVSEGIYAGLNTGLGSSDDTAHVKENRQRIVQHLGADAFLTVHQHHSAVCIRTRAPWNPKVAPHADAIVTSTPGLAICAQAADCGPVLFADPNAKVIGAAHAGWKGALFGVLEATIEAMEAEGANRSNIHAVLGPSISAQAYEVGPDYAARFTDIDATHARYFTPSQKTGHKMFDLPAFTLDRLKKAGVSARSIARCTYGEPDLFFSYRRATHRNEADYGRLASAIMLTHDKA